MICITAVYPNTPGSRFDSAYYRDTHTPMATTLLTPHGLRSIRTAFGAAALDGGAPPFWTISEMVFDTREAFDAAMTVVGAKLFADLPNYTDTTPVLQVSSLEDD